MIDIVVVWGRFEEEKQEDGGVLTCYALGVRWRAKGVRELDDEKVVFR